MTTPNPNNLFCQVISYDRSRGFCGEMYVGMKPVTRAIVVVKSTQESSVMVQRGFPYIAFMTAGSSFYGTENCESRFFASPEEAMEFVRSELPKYKRIGEAYGPLA